MTFKTMTWKPYQLKQLFIFKTWNRWSRWSFDIAKERQLSCCQRRIRKLEFDVYDIEIERHRNHIEFNSCRAHNPHGCHHVGFFRPSAISAIVAFAASGATMRQHRICPRVAPSYKRTKSTTSFRAQLRLGSRSGRCILGCLFRPREVNRSLS